MLHEPLIVRGSEQPNLWLLQDFVTPLLDGNATNGRIAMALARVHPGGGPPPHVHAHDDEGFFVLEGQLTLLAHDKLVVANPGDFVWAPKGVTHAFKCTSDTPAKFIVIVTPSAFGEFTQTLAKPAFDFAAPPALDDAIFAELMRVAPQYGITMQPEHPMPTCTPMPASKERPLWVFGEHVTTVATAAQTGGHFTVSDIVTAPAGGPPPHVHTNEDELIYVIEGTHEFLIGETTETAGPGDLVCAPRGTRHRYGNVGETAGRLLSVHTPGGFEAFFNEVGIDATAHATAPATPPPPADVIADLFARHGMTA